MKYFRRKNKKYIKNYKFWHTILIFLSIIFIFRSEEHTSELQSQSNLVCRLLLEKKKHFINKNNYRGFAHAPYLHQASCLLFYSINAVYNQYNAINSCKGSDCIFCTLLIASRLY